MSLNDQFNNFQTSGSGSSTHSNTGLSNATDAQLYNFAVQMIQNGSMPSQVKTAMVDRGVDPMKALMIVNSIDTQIDDAKKAQAKRDILFGALWCIGGIALTMADVGFIFWGAIVFGVIQLIKGLVNLN